MKTTRSCLKVEILTDPPITSKTQDRLKRSPLAEKIAQMIMSVDSDEHFVIGIEGEWGSGKTSFIELVIEALGQEKDSIPDVIRFNPWNFSNADGLYAEFFSQLGEKLGDTKDAIAYAKKLFQKVEKIEVKPEFFGFSLGNLGINLARSLDTIREEINKKLKDKNRKIIIVIDDIDRLDKRETRDIFKLVKVNANFPNVIYLLAYDRPKVERILDEDGFPGSEYLKKIIQVSFSLPKPEKSQLYNILFQELDKVIESKEIQPVTKKLWSDKRWGNLFHGGYKNAFSTVRDIKRYISSWRLDYLVVGYNEVNPVDFAGTELIRVIAPQVYDQIAGNKDFFTKTDSFYIPGNRSDDREAKKKLFEEILSYAPKEAKEVVIGVCKQLFPQIDGIYTNTSYPYSWQQEWRKELRVCATDIFDTYFLLSLPSGGIPQSEIELLMGSLDDHTSFAKNIENIKDTQKLRSILDRVLDFIDDLKLEQRINLLQALFDVGDKIEDDDRGFIDEGARTKLLRLCYQVLKRIDDKERIATLTGAVNNSEGLYSPLYLMGTLIQEYKEHKEKASSDKSLLLSDEDAATLRALVAKKVNDAAENGLLKNNKHLAPLLIWWMKWSSEPEAAKKYAAGLLKNKKDFYIFLGAFKTATYSQTLGDYVSVKKEKLDAKSPSDLVGQDNIQKCLKKYSKGLTLNQKEIVKLYQRAIKGEDNW